MADDNQLAATDDNQLAAPTPVQEPPIGAGPQSVAPWLRANGQTLDPTKSNWCGAFTNAALNQAGLPTLPLKTAQIATNWVNYGAPVSEGGPQKNDVLVMPRGLNAGQLGGHVGVATGETRVNPQTGGIEYGMRSGNAEGNRVSVDFVPASELVVRRPATMVATAAPAPSVAAATAAPAAPVSSQVAAATPPVNALSALNTQAMSPMQRLTMYRQLAQLFAQPQRQQQAGAVGPQAGGVDASIPLRVV
jgi:hypothetical protein